MYLPSKINDWAASTEAKKVEPWQLHLLAAADLIRKHGLAKYTQLADDGSMCVHGALSIAIFGEPYRDVEWDNCEAASALKAELDRRGVPEHLTRFHAADWNNEDERTADEVIEVLEAAARGSAP